LPYLNSGVLFGIGAAINFYINEGSIKRAPSWMRKLHFEWLYRVVQEPNRIGKRAFQYLILIPSLIFIEINHKRKGQ
jgi:N-acetylglucosaminyldiphosphoundecaprenol N-acetyl-beta-D-mannosaminyltransferase